MDGVAGGLVALRRIKMPAEMLFDDVGQMQVVGPLIVAMVSAYRSKRGEGFGSLKFP